MPELCYITQNLFRKKMVHTFFFFFVLFSFFVFHTDTMNRKSKSVSGKVNKSPKLTRKALSMAEQREEKLANLNPLDETNLMKRGSVRRDSKLRQLVMSRKFQTFYQLREAREEMLGFGMRNQPIFDHIPGIAESLSFLNTQLFVYIFLLHKITISCLEDAVAKEDEILAEIEARAPDKIWEADKLPEYARSHIVARKLKKDSVEARMKGEK